MISTKRQLETASIVSLFTGKAKSIMHGNKEVSSAIYKEASTRDHWVSKLGIEGDEQGDKVHHGGLDKAICVYLEQSYTHWQKLGHPLEQGAFGENLMINVWTEDNVHIGDIFQVGEVIVQVSQPRQPCYKLGIRNEWPNLVKLSQDSGYTGFYMRVLQEGSIHVGMEIKLLEPAIHSLSIFEANKIMYEKPGTIASYEKLATVPELADVWKHNLQNKIIKLTQS